MRLTTLEHLHRQQINPVVTSTVALLAPHKEQRVSTSLWLSLLTLLFSIVQPAAAGVASISRTFYDEERERIFPGLPRHDIYLAVPEFEQFVQAMEPLRPSIQRAGTTDADISRAARRAALVVENAGRWTMTNAARDDFVVEEISNREARERSRERRGLPVGWARVPTGAETCGWCLMLASRGPVYRSAETAGEMNQWHDGCDCKIVPAFKSDDWEGRERYLAAEDMWKRETKGYSGKDAIRAMERAAYANKYQEYLRDRT